MVEDYYSLLGVEPTASEEAILRAYREKVADTHPDVNDDSDAGDQFKRLNRAKSVPADEQRRRTYDRLGHERFVARNGDELEVTRDPSASSAGAGRPSRESGAADRYAPRGSGTTFDELFERWRSRSTETARNQEVEHPRAAPVRDGETIDLRSSLPRSPVATRRRADRRESDGSCDPERAGRTCPKCGGRVPIHGRS